MIKWVSILAAAAGIALGVYAVSNAFPPRADPPLSRPPSINPFPKGVAALGTVESREREIEVAAPEPGLVVEVLVDVGSKVASGDPLLRLDARPIDAELLRAQAAVREAAEEIARWYALPRAEDLPPLEADVARARAELDDRKDKLARLEASSTANPGSVTARDISQAQADQDRARAEYNRVKGVLDKAKAGGWKPDLELVKAAHERRKAEVAALELLRDRLTVRATRPAVVLRRDVEPGVYAAADRSRPLLVLGTPDDLHVRARVDEEDISLVPVSAVRAIARTRGAVVHDIELTLVRIEPLARAKAVLNGSTAERVDTRTIDVVFRATPNPKARLYPGQAVDVYIERQRE